MAKIKIDIAKEYNLLSVFFDDNTQIDQVPQTTNSDAVEVVLNDKKVAEWVIKLISFDVVNSRVFIFNETFPSNIQEFEVYSFSDFTAPQQTIINDFIALL